MKKFVQAALFASASIVSVAHANFELTELPTQSKGIQVNVAVYQNSDGTMKMMSGKQISKSNPAQHLCWHATADTPVFTTATAIKETFLSPVGTKFTDSTSNFIVQSSLDGTRHIISGIIEGNAENILRSRCWQFNPQDTTGEYTLNIEINGQPLSSSHFTVTP